MMIIYMYAGMIALVCASLCEDMPVFRAIFIILGIACLIIALCIWGKVTIKVEQLENDIQRLKEERKKND